MSRQKRLFTLEEEKEIQSLIKEIKPVDKAFIAVGVFHENPEELSNEQNQAIGDALWKFARIGLSVCKMKGV